MDISGERQMNNIDIIKQKYNIDENTGHQNIKLYILQYMSEQIFDNFIKNNKIIKYNNLYIYCDYLSDKQSIIKHILIKTKYKKELKELICCFFNSIIKSFDQKKKKIEISKNEMEISKIKKNIQKLSDKKEEINEYIDERNSLDTETSYKQSRIEIEITNELQSIMYQKAIKYTDSMINRQQLEAEIYSIEKLNTKRNSQIQTLQHSMLESRHYIEDYQADISAQEIKHRNEENMKAVMKQSNELQEMLIDESIKLRSAMNESFTNMINAMRDDNQKTIDLISQTAKLTRDTVHESFTQIQKDLVQTSQQMQRTIQEQSKNVQETMRKNAEESRKGLNKMNDLIQEGNQIRLKLHEKMKQILFDIAQTQANLLVTDKTANAAYQLALSRR